MPALPQHRSLPLPQPLIRGLVWAAFCTAHVALFLFAASCLADSAYPRKQFEHHAGGLALISSSCGWLIVGALPFYTAALIPARFRSRRWFLGCWGVSLVLVLCPGGLASQLTAAMVRLGLAAC